MYTANKPLFEFFYNFIYETFLLPPIDFDELIFYGRNTTPEEDRNGEYDRNDMDEVEGNPRPLKKDRIFKKFLRGPKILEQTTRKENYPLAWLELGEIRDVEFDRAPQGFSYVLRYQMPIFVRNQHIPSTGLDGPVHETFRSVPGRNRGIGDIISEVVDKVWSDLHISFSPGGNFDSQGGTFAHRTVALDRTNWWVKHWTVDVNGDVVDTIAEWKEVMSNDSTCRAKTINWDFTIFEQQPLT